MLRPLKVVNPYAKELTFPDRLLRTRRDHMKYLTLIRAIAEQKMPDLNANDLDAASKIIAGTARSMGVDVKG
ncbi:50S ribosomal protein L11 [compost metagenome]